MGPADPTAPTGQQQTPKGPVQMSTENILVKVSDKPNAPSDYDSFLRWTWADDSMRPTIYTTDQSGHYWDGRNSVKECSR